MSKSLDPIFIIKKKTKQNRKSVFRAGDVTLQLRAHADLAEGPSSVHRTHTQHLTAIYISGTIESCILFWLLYVLHLCA